jgi:hypothetical protein
MCKRAAARRASRGLTRDDGEHLTALAADGPSTTGQDHDDRCDGFRPEERLLATRVSDSVKQVLISPVKYVITEKNQLSESGTG